MEKAGNLFVIAKMWEKHLKKKEILRKGSASLLKFHTGKVFSVCLCKPAFSVSRISIPGGLFQTITELKRLMSYSKRLH